METLTLAPSVSDLITSLKPVFLHSDLSGAERILSSWAESLKSEVSKSFADELFLLEVEKSESEFRNSRLEKEFNLVKEENVSLREKVSSFSEILEEFKKRLVFESIEKGGLQIEVFSLENELELVEKENVSLKEKLMSLSKIAEESQTQKGFGDKGGRDGDCFANKTPTKRAYKAVCSDSESQSDDNLPIGEIFNIKRVNKKNLVVKNSGSRKRRSVQVGAIGGHGVSGRAVSEFLTVGNEPGLTSEPRGSGFTTSPETGSKERCELDDFSDIEDYGECEMNEADCSGSPVARKMSSRKRNRKLIYIDAEEEKDEIKGSESCDQVNESGPLGSQPAAKVAPEINLDDSEIEEEDDTESESEDGGTESDSVGDSTESHNECDSLSGFIEKELDPEDAATFVELLKNFNGEKKTSGKKWEYEAEMLADFGKDPVLCLHAVCALNRQQTEEEQDTKSTLVINHRGFNQMDAHRGSEIAQFLTDNNPWGPLKKTVEDLQEYDPGAIEICEKLAMRYSKQLFEIFHSGEDPYFNCSIFDL